MKTWHKWVLGIGGVFVAMMIAGAMLPGDNDNETGASGLDSEEIERIIDEGFDPKVLEDIIDRAPTATDQTVMEQLAETDFGLSILKAGFIEGYTEDGTSRREAQCVWDAVEKDMVKDIEFWMNATDAETSAWILDWFLEGSNLEQVLVC